MVRVPVGQQTLTLRRVARDSGSTAAEGFFYRILGQSLVMDGRAVITFVPSDFPVLSSIGRRPKSRRFPASMWRLLQNFLLFLREEKKWWLVPLVAILLLLVALLLFTGGSALAPLMYPVR